jgi:hypothetical protein
MLCAHTTASPPRQALGGAAKSRQRTARITPAGHSCAVAESGAIEKLGPVTAASSTEIDRLAALVDRRLAAMERANKPPTVAELNAVRRLIDWLNGERAIEQSRTLTTR